MKYIRKEISKGVKPIADQDFKITGDIDITGNYLQNGSPFSSFDATASNTFSASQKVDVTDNSNPAFKITQKGTGDALLVEDDAANPDTTPFVVKADGKVGIGKTAPAQPLDVVGNINTTGNYLVNGSPLSTNITKQENKVVATSDAQTVFTFSTAFIGYDSTTPANSDLDVYWNGARLIYGTNNDYTITANNAITLTSGTGVQSGDIIYINSRNNIILDRDYTP